MARMIITLDSKGIGALLKSAPVAAALQPYTQQIAAQVRSERPGADVVVNTYQTDRAAASVTVRDRQAMVWQARDGLLTRAAARTGLEVRARA